MPYFNNFIVSCKNIVLINMIFFMYQKEAESIAKHMLFVAVQFPM